MCNRDNMGRDRENKPPQPAAHTILGRTRTVVKEKIRKQASRCRLLTTNTLSLLLPLSISPPLTGTHKSPDIHSRTLTTLRKIHNKHHSILIPSIKDNIEVQEGSNTNTELQLEHILLEFDTLSTLFDNTAKRIKQSMDSETERTTDSEFGSQFNHTFVLPIEAALQYALDDFATYTNTISLQHELTLETIRNNNTTNHAINYDNYDDDSIDKDSQPNTTELEQTYSRDNVIPHTSDSMHQPLLIKLLLRYETPSHQQNTTHERRTPILPPWNSKEITLQHCTHQTTMPILPPKLTIPPVPDVPQPTTWTISEHPNMTPPPITQTTSRPITALPTPWTHNIATPPHYHQSYQAETEIEDEYIKYDNNNQYQQELHGNYDNNNTTTDEIGENTTVLRINNNSTNYTSRASTRSK